MINNNRDIFKHIIYAQAWSDKAKFHSGIPDIVGLKKSFSSLSYIYSRKHYHIEKAVDLILKNKPRGISFFYEYKGDYQNIPYVIYFNYKIYGESKQISFHSKKINRLKNMDNKKNKRTTYWRKNISSRWNVAELINKLNI